jgi:hypothetical protein
VVNVVGLLVVEPVPLSVTVCGEFAALSTSESVAVRVPVAAGSNVTTMLQLAPGATLLVQLLLVTVKSPAFVPLIAADETERAALPLFVTVSV